MKKIIYDFGANNGDNIPYYSLKADLIIAVEANPELCLIIENNFKDLIKEKRLIVENCILTANKNSVNENFYLHTERHLLSQFPKPSISNEKHFKKITVSAKSVMNLIEKYGNPYYIKIDLENYDDIILEELFINKIIPNYISAESNNIKTFALMIAYGKYNSFKLVNGSDVHIIYKNQKIKTLNGYQNYSFPIYSSGPFGNDINGPWITPENFFYFLGNEKLGWKDIHCSLIDKAEETNDFKKYYILNNNNINSYKKEKIISKNNFFNKIKKKYLKFLSKF
jgi:hypothetical protein